MQRAWLLVLFGCGFQSALAPADGGGGATDGPADSSTIVDAPEMMIDAAAIPDAFVQLTPCVAIAVTGFTAKACASALTESLPLVATTMAIDTDSAPSSAPGLVCAPLTADSTDVCAVVAMSISVPAGVILSAHGSKPLVLLAHSIDIEGTIDVSSRIGRLQGPASDIHANCQIPTAVNGNGGGAGGTFNADPGGAGGSGPGTPGNDGGAAIATVGISTLRGGCPGDANSSGILTTSSHGGGAVWLAVDRTGTLTLGDGAIVDASGAGGAGGAAIAGTRGGYGGGSGGMILLSAATLMVSANTQIFANGGGGGGGSGGANAGTPGLDPPDPANGGGGGSGAVAPTGQTTGTGGIGFPVAADQRNGGDATGGSTGAGGGGGGAGVIRLDVGTMIGTGQTSPAPTTLR